MGFQSKKVKRIFLAKTFNQKIISYFKKVLPTVHIIVNNILEQLKKMNRLKFRETVRTALG